MSSILTSAYPLQHGVFNFGDSLSGEVTPLSKVLKKNGYATAFLSSHKGISTIRNFDKYFDSFYCIWIFGDQWDDNKFVNTQEVTPLAIKWIENNKNSKFFIWIHYLEPHFPMISSFEYKKMFAGYRHNPEINNLPLAADEVYGIGGLPNRLARLNNYNKNIDYYINLYDASIRYADDQLGQILNCLKALHLSDKTLVIISADHGEGLGRHGLYFTHGFRLYDELIRVPLIIYSKGLSIRFKEVKNQVRQIDIAPTILGLLGIRKTVNIHGANLAFLIKGEKVHGQEYAFSFLPNKLSVRTNGFKLIYDTDHNSYEFYNLRNDAEELNSLPGREDKEFINFKDRLAYYADEYGSFKGIKTRLSDEEKKALHSLGYLQ